MDFGGQKYCHQEEKLRLTHSCWRLFLDMFAIGGTGYDIDIGVNKLHAPTKIILYDQFLNYH